MCVYKGEKNRKKRGGGGCTKQGDEKRKWLQRKGREMKEESREDTEAERTGDIPLGESHR